MSIALPTNDTDSILKTMRLLPWKFHELNGEQYVSKFWASSDSYCFLLSDLNALYLEYLVSSEIGHRFEELNPGMQMPLHRILSLLEKVIPHSKEDEESGSLNIIKIGNNKITVQSKTTIAGIPLIWEFILKKYDGDLLKEQLLEPLIGMLAELQQRQNFLISLIRKKDAEIEDYKEGGAKVSRKYLETLKFEEDQFLAERSCPEALSETLKSSAKTTFDYTNDNFYVAVATAHSLIREQNRLLEDEQLQQTAKDAAEEDRNSTRHQSHSEETEKEREIARRKQLEQKLLSKPAKKKKKIAF